MTIAIRRAAREGIAAVIVATLSMPVHAATQATPSAGPGPAIQHVPVSCFVAGQIAQLDAVLTPPEDVTSVNIYFHSALGNEDYYTAMARGFGDQFQGTLPPPTMAARTITYRIEATGTQGTSRTAEHVGTVVRRAEDCDGLVAAVLPGAASPSVFSSMTGTLATAVGFGGAAGATGGGISGTTLAIAGGAAALGIGTVIVVKHRGGDNNASPSR
jgi:hypothetical protein